MKKFFTIISILILIFLLGKLFIKKDIPTSYENFKNNTQSENIDYPDSNKNVTINNIDFFRYRVLAVFENFQYSNYVKIH